LVTGHTGFKGAWLTEWLLRLGASVSGYSLGCPDGTDLHQAFGHPNVIDHREGDVRNADDLARVVAEVSPDVVFHLAAQPLVRESYRIPAETYAVNVTGTIHLLEALRELNQSCAAVFVTSDKCYENREWLQGYREDDSLGGHDPYSSSKAAAEIAVASWRRAFFTDHPVKIATARAGNVIGGGDWAKDRIIPDAMRALIAGEEIIIRNPHAVRPWQHVLEPLAGYLWLGACLASRARAIAPEKLAQAFNFGPAPTSNRNVGALVEETLRNWPGKSVHQEAAHDRPMHEAGQLRLATDKAAAVLGWTAVWDFEQTVHHTVHWYRAVHERREEAVALTRNQIAEYVATAKKSGIAWADGD
jgi:CDP-glucose 4,6-dehydratase